MQIGDGYDVVGDFVGGIVFEGFLGVDDCIIVIICIEVDLGDMQLGCFVSREVVCYYFQY